MATAGPTAATGFNWASGSGQAVAPPSAEALARAQALFAAPAPHVDSLAQALVGTATLLVRALRAGGVESSARCE